MASKRKKGKRNTQQSKPSPNNSSHQENKKGQSTEKHSHTELYESDAIACSASFSANEQHGESVPPEKKADRTSVPPEKKADRTSAPPEKKTDRTPVPPEKKADRTSVPPEKKADRTSAPPEKKADRISAPPEKKADHTSAPPEKKADHTPVPPEKKADRTSAPPEKKTDRTPAPPEKKADHTPVPPEKKTDRTPAPPEKKADRTSISSTKKAALLDNQSFSGQIPSHKSSSSRIRTPDFLDAEAEQTQFHALQDSQHHLNPKSVANPVKRLAMAALFLGVLFIILTIASGWLYQQYNPDLFVQQILSAIQEGNSAKLQKLLTSDSLTISEENAALLCNAFSGENAQTALREQLELQTHDPTQSGVYEALSVEKSSVFLGYCKYQLKVAPVSLLLKTDAQNVLLSLNDTTYTGTAVEQGILYENLFPGRYTCSVSGSSSIGQALSGEPTTLDLFRTERPFEFDGALPILDITVSGFPNDECIIYVDGTQLDKKPVNGQVLLPQIALNSVISMKYTAPHGAVITSSLTFQDSTVTNLAFTEFHTEGATPDETTINHLLNTYYASFLNACNQQSTDSIAGATETMRQQAAELMKQDPFFGKILQHFNAAVNFASVIPTVSEERPAFLCNIAWAYTATPVGESTATNQMQHNTCEFVFENNAWVLNRTAVIDETRFSSTDISALTPPTPAAVPDSVSTQP